jgi:hypothetical protein
MITAFITSKNNPKVRMVTGSVNNTRIGFTIKFKIARTTATIIAVKYPATATPGRNLANKTTTTAVKSNRIKKFILYWFWFVCNKFAKKTPEKSGV